VEGKWVLSSTRDLVRGDEGSRELERLREEEG